MTMTTTPNDAELRADGMPRDPNERYLRRMLAVRVAMPHTYFDDGEAQGQEHGISIDFMRESVADIDAKLHALDMARYECSKPAFNQAAECSPTLTQCPRCNNPHHPCDRGYQPVPSVGPVKAPPRKP